jgi:phosphatidylserine/phosphatidylglycerophosphate/cardiolipin synthase-like enzyme
MKVMKNDVEYNSGIMIITRIVLFIIISLTLTGVHAGAWWRVYFTHRSGNVERNDNPESALITLLGYAERSFYGAFYDISSNRIIDAMIEAHKRGVVVNLVTERDNSCRSPMRKLLNSGISVVTDTGNGLMHNKFAIIDDRIVWTGSFNLTRNGSLNNNNAVAIWSRELALIYKEEFCEMFDQRIFGNRSEQPFSRLTNRYYVKIGDAHINVFFSPDNNIDRILRKRIERAQESIHFMLFSFTSDLIGEAIIKRYKRGVKVYGLMDRSGAKNRFSEYVKMKLEGIPVKLGRNRYKMHHKVLIIDGRILITGSYNFSRAANRVNDENIIIIDNAGIAQEYLMEFDRLYGR